MTGPIHTPSSPLVGQLGTTLSEQPRQSSLQQMERIAGTAERLSEDQQSRFERSATSLLSVGAAQHRSSILAEPDFQGDPAGYDRRLQQALGWVEGGHRTGYYHAFRWLFVLTHYRLNDSATHSQAAEYIQRFTQLAEDYRDFFTSDSDLSPLHQFRYLHHTARITRTLLARIEDSPEFAQAHPQLVTNLHETLSHLYSDLLDDAQGVAVHQMEHGEISPLVTDIEMRQALLAHNYSAARSLAWRLIRFYENHPLSDEEPEDSEAAWIWRAGRESLEDGLAVNLANELHETSDAERSQMILNSLAAELVVQAAASVDGVNREAESEIQNRYQAYSTVATVLILAHPGMNIREITSLMAHDDPTALQQDLDRIAESHPDVAERIAEVRESLGEAELLAAAQGAATHILELSEGPGRALLEATFTRSASLAYNPVAQVRQTIAAYPQIITDLELSYDHSDHEAAALELLRSGPQAAQILQGYALQVPPQHRSSIQAIATSLATQPRPEDILNQFAGEMVEIYEASLRTDSEATFAGVVNSLHLLNSLEDYAEGIPVHEALHNRSGTLLDETESFGFGVERGFNRMLASDSLWSLAAGALVAEFLPAFLLARASTTARAGNLGRLVAGGALTWRARILTGFVTGTTMSLVGTSLHHRRRAQEGLRTDWGMWGEDLAVSTAMNTVIFGTTMLASAPLARALTPEAQAGATVTRMSLARRIALRAGTAALGGTVALGTSVGLRLGTTGHLSTSWEEVAENYLSLILFETMAGGMRYARQRVGIGAELRGRAPFRGLSRGERIAALDQITIAGEEPGNTQRYVPDTRSAGEIAEAIQARRAGRSSAVTRLQAELAEARTAGDSGRVAELQSRLARLRRQERWDGIGEGLYRNRAFQGLHEFFRFGSRAQTRLGDAFRQRMAGIFNDFFTVLGTERVRQIDGLVDAMIEAEPDLTNYRENLRYQLALREAAAPGSLDVMLARTEEGRYAILEGVRPQLNFESGVPQLEFVDAAAPRSPEAGRTITERDLLFLRRQLEDSVPGQEHHLTLLQEIDGQPGQVLRLYLHPVTRQIMSIGNPPEIPEGIRFDPLVYDAVIDPVSRRIMLPPLEEGGAPSELPYGEIMDYYQGEIAERARLNPFGSNNPTQGQMQRITPYSWTNLLLTRLRAIFQRSQSFRDPGTAGPDTPVGRIRQQMAAGEWPSRVWVYIDTSPRARRPLVIVDPNTPAEQMPQLPEHYIRFEGQLNRFTQTITLPPTREMGGQGEVVLNFENQTITTPSTVTAQATGSGARATAGR